MANVAKVTNIAAGSDALNKIGRDARNLAVEIARPQEEVAALYASIAQGGTAVEELARVSRIAGRVGVAFDISSEAAGDAFMKIKNALGATTDQTEALMDTINALSNANPAKAKQLIDFFQAGGAGASRMMNVTPQVGAAIGTMFIRAGKSGEEAATIMERFTKGAMKMNTEAGRTFQKAGGGLNGLLAVLEKGKKLSGVKQFEFFKAFGEYGPEVAQMANNFGEFSKVLKMANDKQAAAGSVNAEFANRMATTKTKLAQAKIQFNDIAITIGSQLLPILNPLLVKVSAIIGKVAAWVEKNPKLTKQIVYATAIFAGFMLTISAISGVVSAISTAVSMGATAFGVLSKAIRFLGTAFSFVARLFMANPILLVIAAIALAAYLIYRNWDKIKVFFINLWAKVKEIFLATWEWVKNLFLKYHPLGILINHWEQVKAFFVNLGSTLFDAGANVIKSIWEGMKSLAHKPVELIQNIVGKVRDFLPFSPAKTGPLKNLHKVRIVQTIAETMKPKPMVSAMAATMQAATGQRIQGSPVNYGSGGGVTVNFSPTINFAGPLTEEAKTQFLQMLNQYKGDIARMVEDVLQRKSYKSF
jgi:TP901 family phage tail tape measure protein